MFRNYASVQLLLMLKEGIQHQASSIPSTGITYGHKIHLGQIVVGMRSPTLFSNQRFSTQKSMGRLFMRYSWVKVPMDLQVGAAESHTRLSEARNQQRNPMSRPFCPFNGVIANWTLLREKGACTDA